MKKILSTLLIGSALAYSAMIGTGKKQEAGTLLIANYYIQFDSDIIRNDSKEIFTDKFDWREQTYIFKPVYYTEDFLFHVTIPYRKMTRGLTDEDVKGLYDISTGVGYFIPNPFGDLMFLSNVQFPTGKYDESKPDNVLQLGLNRYEIQEELHFFKPVLSTKLPFLIDASVFYHHRFENKGTTRKETGYYKGFEATISAILSKDFYIGPAVYYKSYNREGLIPNKGSSKYQIGFDAFYKINDNNSLTFEYVEDYKVKNRAEGERFNIRYVYKLPKKF